MSVPVSFLVMPCLCFCGLGAGGGVGGTCQNVICWFSVEILRACFCVKHGQW